jgi:hypothetical protein
MFQVRNSVPPSKNHIKIQHYHVSNHQQIYMLYDLRDHLEPFVQPIPLMCQCHQLVHETPMPQSEIIAYVNISNDRIPYKI